MEITVTNVNGQETIIAIEHIQSIAKINSKAGAIIALSNGNIIETKEKYFDVVTKWRAARYAGGERQTNFNSSATHFGDCPASTVGDR